jgi:predicted transposase YdaD
MDSATYVLMGLSFPAKLTHELLKGVQAMEESVTYQEIIAKGEARGRAEGRAEGERAALLRVGRKRLGEPSPEVAAALAAITAEERLGQLLERVVEVETWDELFA